MGTNLAITVSLLRHRSGAEVTVLDDKLDTIYAPADQDLDVPDYYAQARRALRSGRGVHTLIGDDLVAVEPIQIGKGGTVDAVVLVRRLEYVISTVQVVKKAFLEAAAVGLGIALLARNRAHHDAAATLGAPARSSGRARAPRARRADPPRRSSR